MLEFTLKSWCPIVLFLASHLDRERQRAAECPQPDNRVLPDNVGERRILLNDGQSYGDVAADLGVGAFGAMISAETAWGNEYSCPMSQPFGLR